MNAQRLDCNDIIRPIIVHCASKNIPDIFDFYLNKNYQILNFWRGYFWHNLSLMAVHFFISPNVCFCTTSGKKTKRNMRWNMQKKRQKTSPTLLIVTWNIITYFNNFWHIFLTQLAIKWLFKFPPHPMSVSYYLRKSDQTKYALKW